MTNIDRGMYLAMPIEVYDFLTTKSFFNYIITKHNIKFILFNLETKNIVKWIE